MNNCDNCPTKDNCDSQNDCKIKNNPNNKIGKVIGVMSGKGGVGKSTVSAMIARTLRKQGYTVGLLDADITGPSIPRLLNISDKKASANESGIIPVKTAEGIEVISVNLLVEDENQPVLWRGPMIGGMVEQFWNEVIWGELDYLIIDMPPGTGDVALTVMQSIPISGIVMVSMPQDLISMIVSKSINMAKRLEIPVIGIVQNMSYVECPNCNEKIRIFESENLDKFLNDNDTKLLGEFPMSKDMANINKVDFDILSDNIKETFKNIIESFK